MTRRSRGCGFSSVLVKQRVMGLLTLSTSVQGLAFLDEMTRPETIDAEVACLDSSQLSVMGKRLELAEHVE